MWTFATALAAAMLTVSAGAPVVAIDAGHGGAQEGAVGPCGLKEKDLTLSLAHRLARVLEETGMVRPLLLRKTDVTLPLSSRAARANAAQAAVLVSIHANASPSPIPRGIETFFLSDKSATGRLAQLADRENEDSGDIEMPTGPDAALQRVLTGLTLDAAHTESQALAMQVQRILDSRLHNRSRGVLQAPLLLLRAAHMAAVLVEVGFLTHPKECVLLGTEAHQETLAQALANAILAHLAQVSEGQLPPVMHGPMAERALTTELEEAQ